MFLLGDTTGGDTLVKSLDEFLDSQEKAPASFREGGGAGVVVEAGASPGEGGAAGAGGASSVLVGEVCAPGDQGIDGREFVRLLRDIVFLGGSGSGSLAGASFVCSSSAQYHMSVNVMPAGIY